jgi:hypothetical protein
MEEDQHPETVTIVITRNRFQTLLRVSSVAILESPAEEP